MKKIGIVTITDNDNYGNRLQNYAVEHIINEFGYKPYTIWSNEEGKIIKKIKKQIKHIFPIKTIWKRFNSFERFTQKYTTPLYKDCNTETLSCFDYILVGSDQIWNYNFDFKKNKFLPDIEKNKVFSFAASFGVEKIEAEEEECYKKILNNISKISVREDAGKKIVEDLTGRTDVEVLVDPTMLLSAEEWDKVSKRPKQLNKFNSEKYILNYFLGDLQEEWKNEIERVAKENDCEIINILDKNSPFYQTGPSEFLYLEKNAFMVCTDSFHSSVFSIIYDTPFVVFNRKDKHKSMNSRLDTLLSKFNLKNRRFTGTITKDLLECDYTEAKEILEHEKQKSFNFLKKALDIKE